MHYSPNLPKRLVPDDSPYGVLGAVLCHIIDSTEKLMVFASSTSTPVQMSRNMNEKVIFRLHILHIITDTQVMHRRCVLRTKAFQQLQLYCWYYPLLNCWWMRSAFNFPFSVCQNSGQRNLSGPQHSYCTGTTMRW